MQRQFEDALELWDVDQFGMPATDAGATTTLGIDLADHGEEFVLTADVPGFDKEDVELRLSDDTIHVTAERAQELTEAEDDGFYLRSERERQSMSRSVRLPEPVDADAIAATYRNGVVTVTLPKREPSEPAGRSIDIE
ncbi:heat shock protein Hsp20 [Natronobacterium gregoryi SP2]|nr:heat shock protein Hsp20 [Natronobacterium gregoryi SP2]